MGLDAGKNSNDFSVPRSRASRARSMPSSRPYHVAAFFSALCFLGLITVSTALVLFFREPNQLALHVMLGSLGFSILMWIIAFFKRRAAYCPLCKGTPLVNSGALPHSKAVRVFPLSHGMTATLSIIACQRFCCMYCGSDFDLLKPSAHLRGMKRDESSE